MFDSIFVLGAMYSLAKFQLLQQALLRYDKIEEIEEDEKLKSNTYTQLPSDSSQPRNHLFAILSEASRELEAKSWSTKRPFVAKVGQTIFQLLPSLVNSLNASNMAKLVPSDPSLGFLIPECLDVVRVVSSTARLAQLMYGFSRMETIDEALKFLNESIDVRGQATGVFLEKDGGAIASYVNFQMTLSAKMTTQRLPLFKELYLVGILAMYWFDIIPTLLARESIVSSFGSKLVDYNNKTAKLIKRIIDSHPKEIVQDIIGQSPPEWLHYVNFVDAYTNASKKEAIVEKNRAELASNLGQSINLAVAIKASTGLSGDLSYKVTGAYTPAQSVLQKPQRIASYAQVLNMMRMIIDTNKSTGGSKSGAASASVSAPVPTESVATSILRDSMTQMVLSAQPFLSELLESDEMYDSDGSEGFDVTIPTKNLLKVMTEISELE